MRLYQHQDLKKIWKKLGKKNRDIDDDLEPVLEDLEERKI